MAEPPGEVAFQAGGKSYRTDRYGFLDPPGQWDEDFARGMAGRLGIGGGLTESHWKIVRYLRRKFTRERTVPPVVTTCIDNGIRLSGLKQLFPTGYHRGACKIAGINYRFMSEEHPLLTYEPYVLPGMEFKVTSLGFLEDFGAWNERFAQLVAGQGDPPQTLTDRHRRVIRYLRVFYRRHGTIPTVYETCRRNQLTLTDLGRLFPEGYRRGACRMAGLPFLA